MNPIHKTIFLGMIVLCIIPAINAQEILTLGRAIEIAETGSPDLKRSMLNLEQFPKSYRVFYNVYMAQMNLNIAKEELANTQKSYEINLKRYENSDLTGMKLNLYQTQLSERKIAYTQALINYKIELLNLKIQSLYDFEKDGPVFPAELYLKNSR